MTETEWLSANYRASMLFYLQTLRGSDRKLRLLACACVRRLLPFVRRNRDAALKYLDVAKRYADGGAPVEDLAEAYANGRHTQDDGVREASNACGPEVLVLRETFWGIDQVVPNLWVLANPGKRKQSRGARDALQAEQRAHEQLMRCIFGNPFRPVVFNPAWRTSTAVALARQMYDSRDFGAMPILADALQDAGCEDEQVLTHCRDAGPHARGCWVCDAVLGKA